MSDYIDNQNKIFEELQKLYINNRKTLISIQEELQNDFDQILDLHSAKYNLVATNDLSVNPTKYFNVKSRVKTLHSFKEKLYRKNLGLQISLRHQLTIDNFNRNRPKVKKSIFLLDDIIGVRIVTELKYDCNYAYELIKNENQYFEDREILFNDDELNNQPEKMKNGLPIFRIKGIYKNKYGFELQIKSKIDEAWGDMDHSLFYKDYSVSPVKNTVQVTMNNVGHLFDKVEDLLFGLRNSEANYKEKKDEIDFLYELSGSAFNEIKKKLGDNYDLSNIASSIKFVKHATKIKKEDTEVKNLNFDYLDYIPKDEDCLNYIRSRNGNFELIILESLYWYWKTKFDIKLKPNKRNYENGLKLYLKILLDNLCNNVNSVSKLNFITISKNEILKFVNIFSLSEPPRPIYLDSKSIYQLLIVDTLLSEAISEYIEETDFEFSDLTDLIKNIYFYVYSKADISKLTQEIQNKYPDFIELNKLNDFIFSINDKIQYQLNIYKIDENYDTLSEVKFLEKLLLNVLESIKLLNENS